MKQKEFLECGQIVNTHGIKGEVKIESWCETPECLAQIKTLYIDGIPQHICSARVHKNCVIASISGIEDINTAILLKNKIVSAHRNEFHLPEGQVFMVDLIGLRVIDIDTGIELGQLINVLTPSTQKVYVVSGKREILIPAVDEFIKKIDLDQGIIMVHLIEGM